MPVPSPRIEIAPCAGDAVARLRAGLGCSDPVAQVLVRRGHDTVGAARAWVAADERHPPEATRGIPEAVALVRRHLAAGSRIVVHGDYDVDGVCSTAILLRALRSLGADPGHVLPDRITDGYGLNPRTVERLAARGTDLLITVDCAITAVEEVALARSLGMEVLVTDHHRPRADGVLPDAPIVHPGLGDSPFADLCAAGVAHKLAEALGAPTAALDLDLVALATIADVVPLHGENRRLVRDGLRVLAGTAKPGLRALMRVAKAEPARLDATTVAFRLCPRINAAGRIARADAALELVLPEDEARAQAVADELDRLNADRRGVEQRMTWEAEDQVAAAGAELPHALVVAGEGWHPGVAGIVASRLAERHHRPAVVLCLSEDGTATGSARSIPAYDLLGGLNACAQHLNRHGGHRAAAGLELDVAHLEAFAAALRAHATAALTPDDLVLIQQADAVVSGGDLGLALAEELETLAPFGHGNPAVRLLVPAAMLTNPKPMGEGRHLRLTVEAGGVRCRAVAFSTTSLPVGSDEPADAVVALELDDWGGAVEPRLVVKAMAPCAAAPITVLGTPRDWLATALAELDAPLPSAHYAVPAADRPTLALAPHDRRGLGVAGTIAACVASGQPTLVVCADAAARERGLRGRLGGFALTDWPALQRDPGLAEGRAHVVAVDPPPGPGALACVTVLAWGPAEVDFTQKIHQREHSLRPELTVLYRALRDAAQAEGERLEALLRGGAPHRSPALAGRALRVLEELGLVELDRVARSVTVPPAQRTELERSAAFRAYEAAAQANESDTTSATTGIPRTAAAA